VGLLPGALLTGHIDRQRRVAGIQQQRRTATRRSAANAGSVTFTAAVGG